MRTAVAAITVTFNSSELTRKVVAYLQKQTVYVDHIIIVDNHSKDEERKNLQSLISNNVEIVWLNENTGGAGGFCSGMKYAKEKYDMDWYWLMDDDAFPNENCLEELLKAASKLENVGCVAPLIYGVDFQEYQLYHHKKLSRYLDRDLSIAKNANNLKDVTKIEANAFVGPLFSKKAVDSVGVADGLLFIYGDDLEYTYRVSRKFNVYLIKSAIINHLDLQKPNISVNPKGWWKDYYMFRNRFLFIGTYQKNIFPKLVSYLITVARVIKQVLLAILKKEYHGYRRLRFHVLFLAVRDGITKRKGKTIDPVTYIKSVS